MQTPGKIEDMKKKSMPQTPSRAVAVEEER